MRIVLLVIILRFTSASQSPSANVFSGSHFHVNDRSKSNRSFRSQIYPPIEKLRKASLKCIERSTLTSHVSLPFEGRGGSTTTKKKKRRQNNSGFYYGIRDDVFFPQRDEEDSSENEEKSKIETRPSELQIVKPRLNSKKEEIASGTLADIMGETLLELREMREDIMALREEMQYMKEEMKRQDRIRSELRQVPAASEEEVYDYPSHEDHPLNLVERIRRQKEFEEIGREVEKWAHKMLFEEDGEEYGWKEVKCNKMIKNKINPFGTTTCYLKWMKDSRGKYSNPNNDQEFPCIKVFASINAPLEDVCDYLSREEHMAEYNDLVVAHKTLENISPSSKVCWSQSPPILFIKPRDFVTFCHHRWRRDGTQVIVSQACDHPDSPGNLEESDSHACRAYSLRGANFIGRDPSDPEHKTRIAILAHADPGGNIAQWAQKAAVNAVAPIEPFKLFHRINEQVQIFKSTKSQQRSSFVNSLQGHISRPAGMSQLGYACFWPVGGAQGDTKPISVGSQIDKIADEEFNSDSPQHLSFES